MNTKEKSTLKAIVAYIPQLIVEERVLDPYLPDVRGQFRQGTLMFADISGFTAMSEKLNELGKEGAEELTSILNRYFTYMLNIIFSYRGAQIKFGGDSLFLLFLGQQHAARAVRCAIQMQKAMKNFRQVFTSQEMFRLEMSIGINTGEFFEASVGSPRERLYYIFTGPEVNRTAEIEAVANAGEIFIGSGTLHELSDKIEVGQERGGHYQMKSLRARVKSILPYELNFKERISESVIETLASYIPPRLVERIRINPEQAGVEGEHRRATVMFINLLGTNEVIEEYGTKRTKEITQILNDYFLMVHATVNKYGGIVVGCDINTEGDKLLIIFGAPVAYEDDDERAVLCAQEMKQLLADSGLPLEQRIGINTGYVFSGEVGSPLRKEYTVMGDQVNVAARLMNVAEEGQVLIGHSTYLRVANKFVLQAKEPVRVKGKSQPVAVYQVEGVSQGSIPHRELSPGELVGREKEMVVLKEVIERVLSNQGQVLAITGVAGIGKSRLVEELKLLWARSDGPTYIGNCQSYGANTSYLPWIDLLGSFFNLQESDTPEQRREKIETIMENLCPELSAWKAVIGNLLHVPIPEGALLQSLDPKMRRQRLLDVTLRLLHAQAERNPLLLLFDDLQWADTASVELLDYVARNIREYPLLICVAYRPEEQLKLEAERQDNYTNIALYELPSESSLDLVRSMIGVKELPQELSQLVLTKPQGNPFFVEEVVRSLLDAGHLRLDTSTGEYQLAGGLDQVEVPDTIQGVIMARLDQLKEETRNVLRIASVIGRLFQYTVIRDIYPRPIGDEELLRRLEDLARLGLTRLGREKPTPEYYFKHILTQEVTYQSLLFAQRRDLHHKVGEYFEEHYSARIEKYYELLFYHYDRTKDKGKALQYSIRAGEKAKRMFTNQEAIGYYQRALELTAELPEGAESLRSKVQEDLGDIYELTGQYDRALGSYQASQQWYGSLRIRPGQHRKREATFPASLFPGLPSAEDRDRQIATLYHKSGMVYERKGQYETALMWLDKGLRLLDKGGSEKARLCAARAGVLYRQGEHAQALDWCQQSLDIARSAADSSETAHSYDLVGTIHTALGNFNQAIECRQQSLSIYEEAKDLLGQAKVHNNLGVDYYYQGNWKRAKEYYNKSLKAREEIGDVNGVATVSNNLGEILSDQGHVDVAIESFLRCLTTWERIGYSLGVGLSHSNLGRAYTKQRDWRKALEHLKRSLQIFEEVQSKGFLAEVHQRLAEVYLNLGQPRIALECCERSLALTQERKITVIEGVTRRIMGQVHHSLGKWGKAKELLTDSQRLLDKLGVPYELGQTLWQLALLYHDMEKAGYRRGVEGKIRQLMEEATALFEELGVNFDAAKALELRTRYEVGPD